MNPDHTEIDPTLRELLKFTARRGGGYGDLPARVLAYNHAQQTVDVEPLVLAPKNGVLTLVPPCLALQVRWPAGSTWSIVGDLIAGDFGWIRIAGADISAWRIQGTERDPTAIKRRAALSDAVFEPGSQPVSTPLAADAWKAGALVIKAAELLLGDSTATKFIALAVDVVAEIQYVRDEYDLHTHPETGATTGTPTVPFSTLNPVADCAATKVKAI